MKNNKRLWQLTSASVALLMASMTAQAASCPTGTSTVNFTWDGSGSGNQAVWNFGDSSKTYSVNYTDVNGKAAAVDVTMSLRDPANLNFDTDLVDAGKHPYDPAGGCLPSTGETVDEWAGNGSIQDPWDSDCYGDTSASSTGTRKAYGAGFLSWFIKSAQHTDDVYFDFSFSRPAALMGNFTIGDIDGVGLTWTFNNFVAQESPGNSYQDEIGVSASMNGTDVPVTIFNAGAALSVTGQTAKSIYHTDQNNNVNPDDPLGTIHAETATPFNKFSIMYSNGAEDATDEQANPNLYSWWSGTHGATNGASDSQAIRVSGFTFCMAPDPIDYGDAKSNYPTTIANSGANHTMTQSLYLGSCVDGETDGQASTSADGDDTATGGMTYGTCATAGDDEDALAAPVTLTDGQANPQITLATHNTTGADATIACWVDYNADGTFDNATERATATVVNGATSAVLTLPNVPATASTTTAGSTTMRCRLAADATQVANASGAATTGEIEDHLVTLAVAPKTDLKVTKVANKTSVKSGDTVTYTITVENESDVDATAVNVTDNLPTGVTLVKATPSVGTFNAGVWSLPSVKAHTSATLALEVTVN